MANRDSCQIWISTRRTENQDLEAIKKKIAKKIVAPMVNGAIKVV